MSSKSPLKPENVAAAQRLKAARVAAGYKYAKDFYKKFGFVEATYSGHESGHRGIVRDQAVIYADALGNCTPGWLLTGEGPGPGDLLNSDSMENAGARAEVSIAHDAPPPPAAAIIARDVPVFGVGEGGPDGAKQINFGTAIDYAERPLSLSGTKNVFAIYLWGDSMYPRFEPGELLYVNPDRPVRPGDHVLIEVWDDIPGEGPRAFVKKLIRRTPAYIELEQYNPPERVRVSVTSKLYKILEFKELAGLGR